LQYYSWGDLYHSGFDIKFLKIDVTGVEKEIIRRMVEKNQGGDSD
jgi:hypothetical protein